MNYSFIEQLGEKYKCTVMKNEPMALHTSMKIGGSCDIVVCPNSESCLKELITACRENNVKYYVFGRGTNVLVSGNGLRGVVILISSEYSDISTKWLDDETCIITADAGASLNKLCHIALENELTGLEFAYGIPGSIGGAVYMNAGAYGGEIKDAVKSVRFIDKSGNISELDNAHADFSYRHSAFCDENSVITSAEFLLKKGNKAAIEARMNELMTRRKDKQPLEYPSAGSTFKRPVGDYAARLIEECGLKGKGVGGAEVSAKHSGFVINKDNASFDDVMGVVEMVKKEVYAKTGIMLECEMLVFE